MSHGRLRRLAAGAAIALVVASTVTACQTVVVPTPGSVGGERLLEVSVYGDSLTPIVDYIAQGELSGYDVTRHTAGGSHMCGVGPDPATGDDRNWVKIMGDIEAGVDALVIQYQGWQNYRLACGGRMDAFPWEVWKDTDPAKKWRVYLDEISLAVQAAGDRTHVFVVLSIPSPTDLVDWVTPQQITDSGTRTIAARHPEQITAVSARSLFAIDGAWTSVAPCIAQEVAAGLCGPEADPAQPPGWVRLRAGDRIHLACPRSTVMVCPAPSPAGMRERLVLFEALNRHFAPRGASAGRAQDGGGWSGRTSGK